MAVPGHWPVSLGQTICGGVREYSDGQYPKLAASAARAVWIDTEQTIPFADCLGYLRYVLEETQEEISGSY